MVDNLQAPNPIMRRRSTASKNRKKDMPDKPQLIPAGSFSMVTDEEQKTEFVPPPRQAPARPMFKVLHGPQRPAEDFSSTLAVVDDSLLKTEQREYDERAHRDNITATKVMHKERRSSVRSANSQSRADHAISRAAKQCDANDQLTQEFEQAQQRVGIAADNVICHTRSRGRR